MLSVLTAAGSGAHAGWLLPTATNLPEPSGSINPPPRSRKQERPGTPG
jgi:hypothetical protein